VDSSSVSNSSNGIYDYPAADNYIIESSFNGTHNYSKDIFTVRGDRGYMLTYNAADPDFSTYLPLANKIIDTFRITCTG
jgi:hypothetical protein